uniref:Nascent polypeptide-associated complex subunit alpha-like UBA domain-containing protein n=1 Tax=Haptolina ericina TaxID=156174 RepID=A0A7S3BM35_9EUKA|mmetsp:Transcript_63446/g.141484  ORF Transcript_63446/g.141484 Transcript_63446/m.141484 type:complete len:154 (+) Transcript_63446:44-505(+)|eukprot:CAMPEP_0181198170 /NCGR_PEP_ID=MMETSP1096-20121128/16463_1 /TAXON_ID=156174 ORGANISM="Chrysochromulina ericina, Strain CCMP281" /NCGR_SAMPLE_ID=MMETSP1096 /ASSEMBLY_ACC=CAM_ASM_000453 /LENGTH=153 /DNA_ID=CAMNT_0023288193 /DNA_START=44 /DNA_END=505 /DNA_ORIENTATION=-
MGKKKGKAAEATSTGGDDSSREPAAGAAAKGSAAQTPTATEPIESEETEEDEETDQSTKKRDGADISKVTDFLEQKELDSAKASRALASITAEETVDREAERERERELAAVAIDQADVALIAEEMELDKEVAERKLREHRGDVVQTLNTLVSA